MSEFIQHQSIHVEAVTTNREIVANHLAYTQLYMFLVAGHFIMMRSMYSAVSGLKTHQTKMDVIGNNIANVNTVAFKSSSVTFQDILYQTTAGASGANAATGVGGVNAKQIGLGVSMASTAVSIETAGASETTGNPFDIKLTDKNSTNFFIVNDGSQNLFTRAGSFYIDGSGNLCMTSTGYTVMGWQVDPTTEQIKKDTVSALRIMQEKNLTSAPEATTNAVMAGILDENDSDVQSDAGKVMNLNFYDNLGYQYTAKFAVKATGEEGVYKVRLTNLINDNSEDLLAEMTAEEISKIFGEAKEGTVKTKLVAAGYTVNENGSLIDTDGKIYTFNGTDFVNEADTTDILEVGTVFGEDIAENLNPTEEQPWLEGESYSLVFNEDTDTYEIFHTYLDMDEEAVRIFAKDAVKDDYVLNDDGSISKKEEPGISYTLQNGQFVSDEVSTTPIAINEVFNIPDSMIDALGLENPDDANSDYSFILDTDGSYKIMHKVPSYDLVFNTTDGVFESINGDPKSVTLKLGDAIGDGNVNENGNFKNISIDFTQCLNYNNSGKSTIGMDSGDVDGSTGKGRKLGNMIGVSIDGNGKIYGSYDNGNTELLGQIAVAQFSNASGLEKAGESCYQTTLNSGDFDGIGVEVSADGSSMTTGELEMSNVDLSSEFTQMITTQRGFQANSRVITTSDTLLEELVNLKR